MKTNKDKKNTDDANYKERSEKGRGSKTGRQHVTRKRGGNLLSHFLFLSNKYNKSRAI